MRIHLASFAISLSYLGTAPALACTDPNSPMPGIVADSLSYDAIVTARVERAAYTRPPDRRSSAWSAKLKIDRVLMGNAKPKQRTYLVDKANGRGACPPFIPLPAIGSIWVLYLDRSKSKQSLVRGAYPWQMAWKSDPKLRKLLRPPVRKTR